MKILVGAVAAFLAATIASVAHADEPHRAERSLDARNPKNNHFAILAEGGAAHGALYGVEATGARVAAAVGLHSDRSFGAVEVFGGPAYQSMTTASGLQLHRGALDGTVDVVLLGHLRLGLGAQMGMLAFERESGSSGTPRRLFVGVHANVGVDIFTIARTTFFVTGRVDADWVFKTPYTQVSAVAGLKHTF